MDPAILPDNYEDASEMFEALFGFTPSDAGIINEGEWPLSTETKQEWLDLAKKYADNMV